LRHEESQGRGAKMKIYHFFASLNFSERTFSNKLCT
jgi:hypothetical protein